MALRVFENGFSFPTSEKEIQEYWKLNNIFKKSLENTRLNKTVSFLDGPPFLNSKNCHYGHLTVGVIKDIICRYETMKGNYVPRAFAGDCHGLPLEMEAEKILDIKTRDEILGFGIKKFNDTCRDIIGGCLGNWEPMMDLFGRWVSFDDKCLTSDTNYMESVWWAFKQLYQKGLVYNGFKVMPYSTSCATSISNFEAAQNYKTVKETFIYVSFPIINEPSDSPFYDTHLLVWTTTPWTLPSNLAICVNEDADYIIILNKNNNKKYIVANTLWTTVFPVNKGSKFHEYYDFCTELFKGKELVGKHYEPIFPYFQHLKQKNQKIFTVIADNYVSVKSDSNGTGLVHLAPAHGEDDYRVCLNEGIIDKKGGNLICPLDANGNYTKEVTHFKGRYIKEAEKDLIIHLKKQGRVYKTEVKEHSYPFCWRTDTPLIYRAVNSWCIEVTQFKDRLLELNKDINWLPDWAKTGRFLPWLGDARDWVVSRSRFWGTPIPIWLSDDGEESVCVGSIEELAELSGYQLTDLHKEFVDHITIKSESGKILRHCEYTLDCWFESGALPFAMYHYPFENKEFVEEHIPVDFIAEGLDQTRGWFYTLNVLSTALFDKPAFKNCIASGIVLADDGQKMSKRLQNYTDPHKIISKYGADALRMYLLSSPVMKGENLAFSENGLFQCIKSVQLLWFNAFKFFCEYYTKFSLNQNAQINLRKSSNLIDKWIINQFNEFKDKIITDLNRFNITNVYNLLQKFIDTLTNKYIKLSRDNLKGKNGFVQWEESLSTLYQLLFGLSKLMAPFFPFMTELMYQELCKLQENQKESVHLCNLPENIQLDDIDGINKIDDLMKTIDIIRLMRSNNNISTKYPLKEAIICADEQFLNNIKELESYLMKETNLLSIQYELCTRYMKNIIIPKVKEIGQKFRKDSKKVQDFINNLNAEQIETFIQTNQLNTPFGTLTSNELSIKFDVHQIDSKYKYLVDNTSTTVLILLDVNQNEETLKLYNGRVIATQIQKMRKEAGLHPWDKINVYYETANPELIEDNMEYIKEIVLYTPQPMIKRDETLIIEKTIKVGDKNVVITLTKQ